MIAESENTLSKLVENSAKLMETFAVSINIIRRNVKT